MSNEQRTVELKCRECGEPLEDHWDMKMKGEELTRLMNNRKVCVLTQNQVRAGVHHTHG